MIERDVYLRHIKRLEDDNRLLAQVIADERRLRQAAWATYWERCQGVLNKLFMFVDLRSQAMAISRFEKDMFHRLRKSA